MTLKNLILTHLVGRIAKMLKIKELDAFMKSVDSGAFEQEFKLAGQEKKGEMLELLEAIMDAADLANEIATKLIYRGLPVTPGKESN